MRLTDSQRDLLGKIARWWPEPYTVTPETPDLLYLRDNDLILQWDSYGNGVRRWMITSEGRAALAQSEDASRKRGE